MFCNVDGIRDGVMSSPYLLRQRRSLNEAQDDLARHRKAYAATARNKPKQPIPDVSDIAPNSDNDSDNSQQISPNP